MAVTLAAHCGRKGAGRVVSRALILRARLQPCAMMLRCPTAMATHLRPRVGPRRGAARSRLLIECVEDLAEDSAIHQADVRDALHGTSLGVGAGHLRERCSRLREVPVPRLAQPRRSSDARPVACDAVQRVVDGELVRPVVLAVRVDPAAAGGAEGSCGAALGAPCATLLPRLTWGYSPGKGS